VTEKLYVLGHPISHSRSPAMHTAALRAAGIEATYEALDVPPEALSLTCARLFREGARGFNVTLPHKVHVMKHLARIEPVARAIGAVNTVWRTNEGWAGTNTDAEGLVRAMREAGVEPRGMHVVVLGAGGAARAAVHGLRVAGARRVTIAARRAEAASRLAAEFGVEGVELERKRLEGVFQTAQLVVQATSATLGSQPGQELLSQLPLEALGRDAAVMDLVYEPLQTVLLAEASRLQLHTIDGLGMLVHQGAAAFERWWRISPDACVMRRAIDHGPRFGT
jgi:shikimate dehydrogenase